MALLLLAGVYIFLDRTWGIEFVNREPSLLPTISGLLFGIPLYVATRILIRKRRPRRSR